MLDLDEIARQGARKMLTLSERDYVYVWVDGIHTRVRVGQDERLCSLVMVGARLDGGKVLIAILDGYRESTESWAEFLRNLKSAGCVPRC